ncbi:hypothetical protein [Algibacter pacificus]|uniref:hypothetical protein n=1 Tax=Algibacter pacificus TaxID=2599389 RepID=UPI0011CC351F|nr:hypothetical protein [Algibacter pacificus]
MKKCVLLFTIALLSLNCSGQNNENKQTEKLSKEQPKGSWKVDKEFDENGNLIKYDSIYSWSSSKNIAGLSAKERDSMLQSFKSKFFNNYSRFEHQGFENLFSEDSPFSEHFFNDDFFGSDFGRDFMDLDSITEQMFSRQKKFLEKYQSEFVLPEAYKNKI